MVFILTKIITALHWAVSLPLDIQYLEDDANKVIDEKIKNNFLA